MALKRLAVSAAVGAATVALWPGLAWAYGNFGGSPPPSGGGGGPETVGHSGGADADQPPMSVNNVKPTAGSAETVSDNATACTSTVTIELVYVGPGSVPTAFGSAAVNGSGGFSVSGTIPSNAPSGVWVIFATCPETSNVYTATIVVEGGSAGAVRPAVLGSTANGRSAAGATSGSSASQPATGSSPAGGAAAGSGAGAWTPPATWGTPALRAEVVPVVNAAAASAPVLLTLGHPVVAHTSGPLSPTAPWRDGLEGLAGLVAVAGLVKLRSRHGRRRNGWKRARRISHVSHGRRHSAHRESGSKTRGMW